MTNQTIKFHDRICTVDGCTDTIRAKKLCGFHYQRHLNGVAMDERRIISRTGPCLVAACERPRRSRGLCDLHYKRSRRSTACPGCGESKQDVSALCVLCFRRAAAAHIPTEKQCGQCERTLPVEAFGLRKSGEGTARWRSRCRECARTDSRLRVTNAHRDRAKERLAAPYLGLRRYAKQLGIPWALVVERYPADNRCEICARTPQEANPGGRYVRLALDHCHRTGALRGFLCGPCNLGLGQFGDSVTRMRAAMSYLTSQQEEVSACA